jgi:putative membrane protein
MKGILRKAATTVLIFAALAPVAWAQSPISNSTAGGSPSNFQNPGWSGYGPGPWMMGGWGGMPMMGYGGWGGYEGGGWLMMLFGGVILVALLVFIFRALAWSTHAPHQQLPYTRANSAGLHALDERYARGEINREEYLQKKRDILGG